MKHTFAYDLHHYAHSQIRNGSTENTKGSIKWNKHTEENEEKTANDSREEASKWTKEEEKNGTKIKHRIVKLNCFLYWFTIACHLLSLYRWCVCVFSHPLARSHFAIHLSLAVLLFIVRREKEQSVCVCHFENTFIYYFCLLQASVVLC